MPRSTIDPVGSNARCGSDVLSVNELSTTSVDDASRCAVAASAAAVQASATRATRGSVSCHLRTRERLNSSSFCLLGGLPDYWTWCAPSRWGNGDGGSPAD